MAIIGALPFTLQNGTTADATQVMADFNKIISDTNANAASSGANSSITSLSGLSSPPSGTGSLLFSGTAVGGTSSAITVTSTNPAGYTLVLGNLVGFTPASTNPGATTLNVNGTGALAVKKRSINGAIALTGGEIVAGARTLMSYDGTGYELVEDASQIPVPYSPLASAATTDLGSLGAGFDKVNITGNVTITSFGATSTAGEVYSLRFDGALLLTYNAVSLILPGATNITTAPNDTAIALALGAGNWQVLSYTRALNGSSLAGATGLSIKNNAVTPNTQIDVAATAAIMASSAGYGVQALSPSVTVNCAATGANGLDTGALANNTWYHIYLINNGTTTAGLASASATAPTLPSGYTFSARVGAMKTDGSANLYRSIQKGKRFAWTVVAATNTPNLPILSSGATGSTTVPTWTAFVVQAASGLTPLALVPPTATEIDVIISNTTNSTIIVAPNNAYGVFNSTTNPPPVMLNSLVETLSRPIVLESTSIYAAAAGATALVLSGGFTESANVS